jgi:hypothetical protein
MKTKSWHPNCVSVSASRIEHSLSFLVIFILTAFPLFGFAAESREDSLWEAFRLQNPFNVQTIALSDADEEGKRVLIVSEPPPTLPHDHFFEALRSIFGDRLIGAQLRRHPIGVDGWVEDVICVLKYSGSAEEPLLKAHLASLAKELFGTSYKAAPIKLSSKSQVANSLRTAVPNLEINAGELKNWLLDDTKNGLISLDSGENYTLRALLAPDGAPGVYFTNKQGLVILILPRNEALEDYRADIRKFALESDAIVGAISIGDARLAVVGRERDTPLDVVPPIRTECVLTLASTAQEELRQSYERVAPFAGKISTGQDRGKDWAPIYLSSELVNTEIGSVLDVADQILKSWSEAGEIDYENFRYPKPSEFPFKEGLSNELQTTELLFNWNTVGFGSVVRADDAAIYSINRTGSLPISYRAEGGIDEEQRTEKDAEDVAFKYFSNLRDTYLARVVQYTALYQIFRAFPVRASRDYGSVPNEHAPSEALIAATTTALHKLLSGSAEPLDSYVSQEIASLARETRIQRRDVVSRSVLSRIVRTGLRAQLRDAGDTLKELSERFGTEVVDRLGVLMADRNSVVLDEKELRKLSSAFSEIKSGDPDPNRVYDMVNAMAPGDRKAAIDVILLFISKGIRDTLMIVTDPNDVRQQVEDAAARTESGYIKTPSVVMSVNSFGGEGGHNLSSKLTYFEESNSIGKGKVIVASVDADKAETILINPQDGPQSSALARLYERDSDESNVTNLLENELAKPSIPIRELKVATSRNESLPLEERGFMTRAEDVAVGDVGYRVILPSFDLAQKSQNALSTKGCDIALARDSEGYLVSNAGPPLRVVRAPTEVAMVEVIGDLSAQIAFKRPAGKPPLRILAAEGIGENELWGVMQSQELRAARSGSYFLGRRARGRPGTLLELAENDKASSGNAGYARRLDSGDLVVLKVANDSAGTQERGLMLTPVKWADAKIKTLGQSPAEGTDRVGQFRMAFEIEIPLTAEAKNTLLVKISAFFKRMLLPAEEGSVREAVHRAVERTAALELPFVADGIVELKDEIIRNVDPSTLQFYMAHGADDLTIVRRETDNRSSGGLYRHE